MSVAPLVVFRADASVEMGSGHVMRCLTLADALGRRGLNSHFLTRVLPGNMAAQIAARGYPVTRLPAPEPDFAPSDFYEGWLAVPRSRDEADCKATLTDLFQDVSAGLVVVDHYALDDRWEVGAVPCGVPVMAIDDLAERSHACDLLLDQNLGRTPSDYAGLVPDGAGVMAGPEFALLRPDFAQARPASLTRRAEPQFSHLLIAMGGMDKQGATNAVLRELAGLGLPPGLRITVVLNGAAPNLPSVRADATAIPVRTEVLTDVTDMAGLMAGADLSVGGAGSTSWERCCLGLPCLMLTIADNQIPAAEALARENGAVYLGDIRHAGWQAMLVKEVQRIMADPAQLTRMAQETAGICDGRGADRVVDAIEKVLTGRPDKARSGKEQ